VPVTIRFAPRQARWIRERRWHRSARVQELLDGSLELHLRIAETSEIKRWVLQFGAEAEVVRPASLRRAVAEELAATLKRSRLPTPRQPRTRRRPPPRDWGPRTSAAGCPRSWSVSRGSGAFAAEAGAAAGRGRRR